ncbi:hypothetical protein KKA00_13080 [bacterium]|nr:hypothetical protein [bacterium]
MKRLSIVLIAVMLVFGMVWAADDPVPGAISQDLIEKMMAMSEDDVQIQRLKDAVLNNTLPEIAVNKQVLKDHNPYFSHEIKTGSITDQKSTGRCWLYAGLNILRPTVIDEIDDKSFEFSQNYLFFWDKIEKANTFLEKVIERRKLDVRSEEFQHILGDPASDGGWWEYYIYLVDKYGVVPMSAMPETESTKSSRYLDEILYERLREMGATLKEISDSGSSEAKLRQRKEEFLLEIYTITGYHLGTPPAEFTFRYKSSIEEDEKAAKLVDVLKAVSAGKTDFEDTEALKEMAEDKASVYETFTPQSFKEKYVSAVLEDYVVLGNDPSRPFLKRYVIENDRNVFDKEWSGFVNVSVADMKLATLQSILNDEPVWFGADIGKQRDTKSGILHADLYKYYDIYGIEKKFGKAERMLYQTEATNHALVFCGVDLIDDKPLKWKVENSWGNDAGDGGFFFMYDNWFDEYVIQSIIHKKYLPERILKVLDTEAEVIEEWEFIAKNWMMK